jgi:hypothetical protein
MRLRSEVMSSLAAIARMVKLHRVSPVRSFKSSYDMQLKRSVFSAQSPPAQQRICRHLVWRLPDRRRGMRKMRQRSRCGMLGAGLPKDARCPGAALGRAGK